MLGHCRNGCWPMEGEEDGAGGQGVAVVMEWP